MSMHKDVQISEAVPNQLNAIVLLHISAFPGFFLTFLGRGFLTHLYRGFMRHKQSCLLTATDERGRVVGFVAFSEDISGFYRYLLKRSFIPFAWYSLLAVFRKPDAMLRLLRALTRPKESDRHESYAELTSIGVASQYANLGIGGLLVNAVIHKVDFNRMAYLKLETDAVGNERVNGFYRRNGFVLDHSYETPEGRKMNEYRYVPPVNA